MKQDERDSFNKSLGLIAKSSVIVFASLIFSKLLSYIYRIIIARSFGPEVYGLFALSSMVVGWFITVSVLGLNNGIARYFPIYRAKDEIGKIKYIFQKVFLNVFFLGILFFILVFLFSPFIAEKIFNEPGLVHFLRFFSISIPILSLLSLFTSTLMAYEKINSFAIVSRIIPGFLKVVLIVLFIILGFESNSVIFSYLLGSAGTLLVASLIVTASTNIFKKRIISDKSKDKVLKDVFMYSWPLLFYGVVNTIFHWTDTFVIGIYNSTEQVGFYNAAVPIALFLGISIRIFGPMFFPLVNKEFTKGNKGTVTQLSQQVGKWVFMINLPLFVLLILFPGAFLNILFGNEYVVAENSLRFLSIGMFFFNLFIVSNRLIAMKGMSRLILYDIIVVVVINLGLNFLLVPGFGIVGASIATMISFIILSLIFVFQSHKELGIIPLRRKQLLITFAGVIAGAALLVIRSFFAINVISMIVLVFLFLVLYAGLILIFKGLDKNDKVILKKFIKRFIKDKK